MATNTTIKLKKSSVPSQAPGTGDLDYGEIAINYADGRLYYKNSSNVIKNFVDSDIIYSVLSAGIADGTADFLDSGSIRLLIDSDYIKTWGWDSSDFNTILSQKTTDNLAEGSTNLYYAKYRVDSDIVADVTKAFVDGLGVDAATLNAQSPSYYLDYNNFTNTPPAASFDSDKVRNIFSVTGQLTYDSATGQFGTFGLYTSASFDSDLALKTTTDLTEGSNLYYTSVRVDSDITAAVTKSFVDALTIDGLYYTANFDSDFTAGIAGLTTNDLTEGDSNLYYTTGRVQTDIISTVNKAFVDALSINATQLNSQSANYYLDYTNFINTPDILDSADVRNIFSVTGALTYDSATGQFGTTGLYTSSSFNTDFSNKSTTDLSEGTNLYYTQARVDSDITAAVTKSFVDALTIDGLYYTANFDSDLGASTTDDLSEGSTNLYYTAGRFDSDFGYKSTSDLSEGTNQYFTNARARSAVSVTDAGGDGSLSYNSGTGAFTYTGPSATEVRAHFSEGTGVTLSSGQISIGQAVGTTDDVTFGLVTMDSATTNGITFNKLPNGYADQQPGNLWFDSDGDKGLSFIPVTNEGVSDVTINIGQEQVVYVQNTSGGPISNGDVVYITGSEGQHGHPTIARAKANSPTTFNAVGVATHDIADNAHGYVTQLGLVRDVDTSMFSAGQILYLSADSDGKFTGSAPAYPNLPVAVGRVIVSDASEGTVLVQVIPSAAETVVISNDAYIGHKLYAEDVYSSHIHLDGVPLSYNAEGVMFYDSANGALAIKNDVSDITLQVGQEQWLRVYNNSGATINNGKAVYITGSNNGFPTIDLANASSAATAEAVGLATHDIDNGTYGYVTIGGMVNDVDTSLFNVGDRLHVSNTNGGLIVSPPAYPSLPIEVGVVMVSDATAGRILVRPVPHTSEVFRVTGDARIDGSLTIGTDLNVVGVTTSAITQSIDVSSNYLQLLSGDTLGTAYQSVGGLDDATFRGNYRGDSDLFYFVRMYSVDSAGAGGDIIEFGISDSDTIANGQYGVPFDSAGGPVTWALITDGLTAPLRNGISIEFINSTGHDSADLWCAHPTELNLQLGVLGNYNPPGEAYQTAGVFRDPNDTRWKFFDGYTPDPDSTGYITIDTAHASFTKADIEVNRVYGDVTGALTGNASTATSLQTGRTIALTGDITATGVSFNGTSNISLSTAITAGSIVNADINASAAIADSKLGTISTAGKVQNSATTATAANTASAIVARDASGNFAAGTISHPDNGKAVFGAGSDLQIFHDGSNSYIDEVGTGDLRIRAANLALQSTTGENYVTATENAEVKLYYDNSERLATTSTGLDIGLVTNLFGTNNGITDPLLANNRLRFTDTDTTTGSAQPNGTIEWYSNDAGGTGVNAYITGVANGNGGGKISFATGSVGGTTSEALLLDHDGKGYFRSGLNITGGLNVDSDITVGGTVDGRDIAADGTKLDGIESGATADQTASEILTLIKTVDGTTSGLDADLLDGQEGSYYLNYNNFTNTPTADNIFKNIAVSGQSTIVADNNNDTLTFAAGTGVTLTTNATSDTLTISSVTAIPFGSTPPTSPTSGQLWWDDSAGDLYLYYQDNDTSQWVQASPSILADGAVTEAKLYDSAVSTAKLRDLAVTNAKIADNAITQAKMADDAVGSAELKSVVSLIIYNSAGTAVKTLYGAGA